MEQAVPRADAGRPAADIGAREAYASMQMALQTGSAWRHVVCDLHQNEDVTALRRHLLSVVAMPVE